MRLSKFIRDNEEQILEEWEEFARRLHSAPDRMSNESLRDHAQGMLKVLADELERVAPESAPERALKIVAHSQLADTAAQAHGGDRMRWGFSMEDMLAEFSALRASIIRLWALEVKEIHSADHYLFNTILDRLVSESLERFTEAKAHQAYMLESMLSYSPDQSYIFDRDGRILYANRALAEAYGKHPNELAGKLVDEIDPEFAKEVHRQIREVLATGKEYRGDFTMNAGEGEVHVVEYLFAPVIDKQGRIEAIAGNSRDITARKAWEETLWKHANHDHLTGVPNRRLFLDRLAQSIRFAKRSGELVALLYVDLDKFKEANDSLGHDGGDQLLKKAVSRIETCIRESDTLARMGGDEFTVILTSAGDEYHVEGIARAILTRLSRPFIIDDRTANISASIGISIFPDHGDNVDDLVVSSDQAMYAAKESGGDTYRFFDRARSRKAVNLAHLTRPSRSSH